MAVGVASLTAGIRVDRCNEGGRNLVRRYDGESGETVQVNHPIQYYDDFLGDVLRDEWNVAVGNDSDTPTVAISAGLLGGRLLLTSGNDSGAPPEDLIPVTLAMLNSGLNFTPGSLYDLNLEVSLGTGATLGSIGMGFTDAAPSEVEQPLTTSTDFPLANTPSCVTGCGFVAEADSSATAGLRTWRLWGVAGSAVKVLVDSDIVTTVATTALQILRVRLNRRGQLSGWINGRLIFNQETQSGAGRILQQGSTTAAVTPATALMPYVFVRNPLSTAASRTALVDYVRIWASR